MDTRFCKATNKNRQILLVELKLPEKKSTTSFLSESLQRATDKTNRVLHYLKQGDWYNSIETARNIFEIFKFKPNKPIEEERKAEIKKIIQRSKLI